MTTVRILRKADRRSQPWKNLGGVTWEIAQSPQGAAIADFDWRISQAEVAAAGPFSHFAGVDRVLTVLQGNLTLVLDGESGPVRLTNQTAPFAFAGDVPVWGEPVGGPVHDLNVMVRRGRARANVERIALVSGQKLRLDLPGRGVLIALGDLVLAIGDENHVLGHLDAAMVEGAATAIAVTATSPAAVIVIVIAQSA